MPSHLAPYYFDVIKKQLEMWSDMSLAERRTSYEEIALARANFARQVRVDTFGLGSLSGEWLIPNQTSSDGVILHLHGGAFAVGSAVSHRAIGTHLASSSGCKVLMLNYRLCPEHAFPAALLDVVTTCRFLQKSTAQKVVISGDSAGANLAICATLYLQDHQEVLPKAIGLMSPWIDLTLANPSHLIHAAVDPYFPNSERLRAAAQSYAGPSENLTDRLISPLFADIAAFPPVLTHVGEFEALYDDSSLFERKLQQAGVQSQLTVFPGMWHVWQHFASLLPEATQSLDQMGKFLRSHLG